MTAADLKEHHLAANDLVHCQCPTRLALLVRHAFGSEAHRESVTAIDQIGLKQLAVTGPKNRVSHFVAGQSLSAMMLGK